MKLFTDIDLDGLGCGVIAKLAFGDDADVAYCSYHVLNQRVEQVIEDPEFDDTELYITDLAVNSSVEKKLEKRFNAGQPIQVIDHHVTAMHFNKYDWGLVKPEDENGKKTCATSLFYDYLIEHHHLEESRALEEFVDLIRQYDTWEWEENHNNAAKRLNDLFYIFNRKHFEEEMLKRLQDHPDAFSLSDTEEFLLDIEDQKIDRYIHSKNKQIIQTFFDDYCVGIIHAEQYLSELGNALHKLNPHLDMIIMLNMARKKVGFRTIHDTVDVAALAARFGGGGHPKASGCDLSPELFEKLVVDVFPFSPIKPDPEHNDINVKYASYGTCYENRKGETTYIRPLHDDHCEVIHNGKRLDKTFESYEKAEYYIKRHYASWIRYDTDYIRHFSKVIPMTTDELKANLETIMEKVLKEER
ncbi:oligoribonuclease NrnB/cAMP/cGMP phosphodiesterase (DHH superfamily) [Pullulanibacillus pueri]|uniref:Oligoribonuclease NrnB n=1 Tax=Pullulanibacillus pueri TaxID=1437324 RepID=A0A8J3ELD8_9BACL|nr:oligoribonuclease [Pullulanibacillus pueri]MBM7680264.1 oligoribonuclease NrnB/cAMP/cGMP phosphodiesterase (DHH superfamily) [Pullulanibacillus pueri]GGH75951.1 oligoribonuclease NrnB [Pullulanibacillus pueri]